jgi:hypothetical protein
VTRVDPLWHTASRVQKDDRDLAAILLSSAAVPEAAGRDLFGLRGELVRTRGRAADAVERVATQAPAAQDGEPLPP